MGWGGWVRCVGVDGCSALLWSSPESPKKAAAAAQKQPTRAHDDHFLLGKEEGGGGDRACPRGWRHRGGGRHPACSRRGAVARRLGNRGREKDFLRLQFKQTPIRWVEAGHLVAFVLLHGHKAPPHAPMTPGAKCACLWRGMLAAVQDFLPPQATDWMALRAAPRTRKAACLDKGLGHHRPCTHSSATYTRLVSPYT